jgi:hypothetical protein
MKKKNKTKKKNIDHRLYMNVRQQCTKHRTRIFFVLLFFLSFFLSLFLFFYINNFVNNDSDIVENSLSFSAPIYRARKHKLINNIDEERKRKEQKQGRQKERHR